MRHRDAQRRGKSYGEVGIPALMALAGCYQRTPYPECWVYSPECVYESADGGSSGDGTSSALTSEPLPAGSTGTESGGDEGGATSGEAGASSGESSTGTTGPEMQAPPMILGMTLSPGPGTPGSCVLQSAGPVTVTVQTDDALEVWMTLDDGEAVALEPVGEDSAEFVGEIAVLGESWNGAHMVSAIAKSGELVSAPWPDTFTVAAPQAGSEAWLKKSALTPSYGNAIAVDTQSNIYELFTESGNQGERCHVRRRNIQGKAVWPDDARAIAVGEYCIGEDIKVAPDGTVWALVNTYKNGAGRWQLWHLDGEAAPLEDVEVGSAKHLGKGLDVNDAGDVLLCGTRPGPVDDDDAWVRVALAAGGSWTVPWDYDPLNSPHTIYERTRDCAFVEDRIVVVGEAFGKLDPMEFKQQGRGFVLELASNGEVLTGVTASAFPAWQSSNEAVAPDGAGGYAVVGSRCNAKDVPCGPSKGVVRWFSPGGAQIEEEEVANSRNAWDVATSSPGHVVVAAQAISKAQGVLVQGWAPGKGALWSYQGAPTTLQVATGVTVGPFGFVYGVGYYLEANDALASGVFQLNPL